MALETALVARAVRLLLADDLHARALATPEARVLVPLDALLRPLARPRTVVLAPGVDVDPDLRAHAQRGRGGAQAIWGAGVALVTLVAIEFDGGKDGF